LKIATFHNTYLGYTETFIYSQLIRLSQVERHSIALAAQNTARFPIERLHTRPRQARTYPIPLSRHRLDPWLYRTLREIRPNLIHAHFGTSGWTILPYARWLRLPLVVSYYGFDVGYLLEPEKHPTYQFYTGSIQKLFSGASLHLALTQEMRGLLLTLGAHPDKVVVHYNGVDLARFSPAERPESEHCTFFFCGREVEKKGFAFGMQAIANAHQQEKNIRVLFLGANGPLRPQIEAQIAALGIQEIVTFADDKDGLVPLLHRSDVIVAPSVTASDGDREGLPTVLVEAAACGVPAIASRHAGIPELVRHNETGLLCEERDIDGLTRSILQMTREKNLRRTLGENARRLAEQEFDIDKLTARLKEYYLFTPG
jgi:colanic acid/amylovoran biosynthesis glycosyltransferase